LFHFYYKYISASFIKVTNLFKAGKLFETGKIQKGTARHS